MTVLFDDSNGPLPVMDVGHLTIVGAQEIVGDGDGRRCGVNEAESARLAFLAEVMRTAPDGVDAREAHFAEATEHLRAMDLANIQELARQWFP